MGKWILSTARLPNTLGPVRERVNKESFWGFLTVLPVILLYLVISILPVAFAIYASFHFVPLLSPEWSWIGVENYVEVLSMGEFWASMGRGVVYMAGSTAVQLAVGLWMALVLHRLAKGQRLLTAVVFTAYLIPTVIVAFWALFMFDTSTGVLHAAFGGWLWGENSYVFGSAAWAMPVLILVGSWKFSVFITIFVLAQLRSIPDRQYEAAKIVGANRWQMFRDVTFPRLKGIILVVVLLRSVFMFNKFDIIWQLTRGGPGDTTTTLPILAYRVTFNDNAYGLGSALAVVMFVFLAIGAVAYFVFFNPSEEVET
jgi:multiple sugar transport system permease protein